MSVPTWVIDPAWWFVAGVGLALILGIIWHGLWYWRHVDRRLGRHLDISRYRPPSEPCDWETNRPRRYVHEERPMLYDQDAPGA